MRCWFAIGITLRKSRIWSQNYRRHCSEPNSGPRSRSGAHWRRPLRRIAHAGASIGDDRERFDGDGSTASSEDRSGTESGLRGRRIAEANEWCARSCGGKCTTLRRKIAAAHLVCRLLLEKKNFDRRGRTSVTRGRKENARDEGHSSPGRGTHQGEY